MTVDTPTAAHYYDDAEGDLSRAAYALITAALVARGLPPPPRAYEIRDAAEAITRALDLTGPVPLARDLARECVAAGLAVFE